MAFLTHHWSRRHVRFETGSKIDKDVFRDAPIHFDGSSESRANEPGIDLRHSTTVLKALSDHNSDLARFLFIGIDEGDTSEGDDDDVPSLGTRNSFFYPLELAPMEVRNERFLMLAEALSIFGALFLNGTWILYEWGSTKGYGETEGDKMASICFETVMALAIACNLLLALFASVLWIMSITSNWSNRDWVHQSLKFLSFSDFLLTTTAVLTGIGIGLGIYSNLRSHWPGMLIAELFYFVVAIGGLYHMFNFEFLAIPLELYHLPFWLKFCFLSRRKRSKLRTLAKLRAKELRARAFHERAMLDPNIQKGKIQPSTSVGVLLRDAAKKLGRSDYDVSVFEARLEEDWINKPDQLRGMSVEFLSRYMPWMLAHEVHHELANSMDASGKDIELGFG